MEAGVTREQAILQQPHGSAHPKNLCTWLSYFIKIILGLSSTGCLHTFHMMRMAFICLMVRIPMSMQICVKVFIPTGTVIFLIIKGERFVRFSLAVHISG